MPVKKAETSATTARPVARRHVGNGSGASFARNLHSHVVQILGLRIVGGVLKPGELLPREETLAEDLKVSRPSLREAMKVLSAKGLVESRTKVGTRVRDPQFWNQLDADVLAWRCRSMPTADFVQKLTEMREIIEPAAAAAAARHRNAAQLKAMQLAYEAMSAAEDREAWTLADLDFHEAMLAATNNELLTSLFSVIETALSGYFAMSARTAHDFKYSLPHHHDVLTAIRKRQPEVARKVMMRLIVDARANINGKRRTAKSR